MEHIVHEFDHCTLRIFPAAEYVETLFHDGRRAGATRDSSEMGNADYARHLGYPDVWTALVCHEAAHTWLAQQMGHRVSPTLWAVAHDYESGTAPYEERLYEEAATLAMERAANTGAVLPALLHPDVCDDPGHLVTAWRRYRAQLIPTTRGAA